METRSVKCQCLHVPVDLCVLGSPQTKAGCFVKPAKQFLGKTQFGQSPFSFSVTVRLSVNFCLPGWTTGMFRRPKHHNYTELSEWSATPEQSTYFRFYQVCMYTMIHSVFSTWYMTAFIRPYHSCICWVLILPTYWVRDNSRYDSAMMSWHLQPQDVHYMSVFFPRSRFIGAHTHGDAPSCTDVWSAACFTSSGMCVLVIWP